MINATVYLIFAAGSWPTYLGDVYAYDSSQAITLYAQRAGRSAAGTYAMRQGAVLTASEQTALEGDAR